MSSHLSPPQSFTAAEREQIERQVERLLSSSYFSNSRRFPSFLRYVVREALEGNTDLLKERTIGVEIFHKEASYDTSTEPIVRVTAAEIRKRIAQYYQEPGRAEEPRVSLPPGSYVPHFDFVTPDNGLAPLAASPEGASATLDAISRLPMAGVTEVPAPNYRRFGWPAVALVSLALLGFEVLPRQPRPTAMQKFWEPITASSGRALVSIPDQTHYDTMALREAADPTHVTVLQDKLTAVIIDDLDIITKLTGVLQATGKPYTLRAESATTLTDLREGPSVLIGAFDNEWTLRLTRTLRFQFADAPGMTSFSIVDTKPDLSDSRTSRAWTVDRAQQMTTNNYTDYAIVARFTDNTTGKPTLIAAGIGRGGTIAAGEFLTSPQILTDALQKKPSAQMSNVEVVLSTRIIDGQPGTPTVERIYFW